MHPDDEMLVPLHVISELHNSVPYLRLWLDNVYEEELEDAMVDVEGESAPFGDDSVRSEPFVKRFVMNKQLINATGSSKYNVLRRMGAVQDLFPVYVAVPLALCNDGVRERAEL